VSAAEASAKLRRLCLALPEAVEEANRRGPTYRVADKIFALDRSWQGGAAAWCKAPAGEQAARVAAAPKRFFVPPYYGSKGWIGVALAGRVDWDEVASLIRRSYRLVAPRQLAERVPAAPPPD
jgi:predicted DNA-binding protein (MmcQ/YjbR family)